MQSGDTARELLRASATDAAAVRQYLESVDTEELNGLLDGISRRDAKKKKKGRDADAEAEQDDWLPLVHALMQCDTTRFRAATRAVQVLWLGAVSELEAMQLLTEVNLGYALAVEDAGEPATRTRTGREVRRRKVLDEIALLLDATYRLVGEVAAEKDVRAKALSQLLGLVPSFLSMLAELGDGPAAALPGAHSGENAIHENLVKLLELPWNARTLPFLLDVLKDSSGLVTPAGWQLLQENVQQMVTTSAPVPAEAMNLIMRECISVATVTKSTQWIDIARLLLRRLPAQSRQEAEFNLQMCLHQSQQLVQLVTLAVRASVAQIGEASPEAPEQSELDNTAADWHDLIFLLHALQASKPILHHRSSSLRVARESSVFKDIEELTRRICVEDMRRPGSEPNALMSRPTATRLDDHAAEMRINDCVSKVINFGGRQTYAREWKALLLMDVALFWVDQTSTALNQDIYNKESSTGSLTKGKLAQFVLLAIFRKAPEAQAEILRSIFERCQNSLYTKVSMEILRKLFASNPQILAPHLNTIQDWLGVQFHTAFNSAEEAFVIASQLSMHHRGLFNFLMVFLRKLLSTNNQQHQQFAINLWCTWLGSDFRFDELQEEEIVAAAKSGFMVCAAIRPWSMNRLEQVFKCNTPLQLRPASQAELLQLVNHEVGRFVQPTARHQRSIIHSDDGGESEDEDSDSAGLRFDFRVLDEFYHQDSSPQGAATAGQLFQKALSCLLAFERAAASVSGPDQQVLRPGGDEGAAVRHWVAAFVSDQDMFFHWICRSEEQSAALSSKRRMWNFLARMLIGSALCTVTIELMLEQHQTELRGLIPTAFAPTTASIWSVMEMEFFVNRMLRKAIHGSEKKVAWVVPRTLTNTLQHGLMRALQPHVSTLLGIVHRAVTFHAEPQDGSRQSVCSGASSGSGISFDALVFVLDLFCHPEADLDKQGGSTHHTLAVDAHNSSDKAILETLLSLYRELADRVLAQRSLQRLPTSSAAAYPGRQEHPGVVFAVYSDAMIAKIPPALRYLTGSAGSAGATVILDAKASEELLGRICVALGRTVTKTIHPNNSIGDLQQQLSVVLQADRWSSSRRYGHGDLAAGDGFVALARALLCDMELLMDTNELTKWKMGAATLCKRLCDVPGALASITARDELSGLATRIMCDHVVHHVPLLRVLLSIAFLSLPFQFAEGNVAPVVGLVQNVLRGCGFSLGPDCAETDRSMAIASSRKRLRQAAGSTEMSDADSDCDMLALLEDDRAPRFVSPAAKSAALSAVITQADRFTTSLVSSLGWGRYSEKATASERRQMARVLVPVLDTLRQTILSSRDLSWIVSKMLLRTLSIVEATLRIGNKCARMSGAEHEETAFAHAVEVFDCASRCAMQCRAWIEWVKEASSDSGSKTRLSATALKVDIFLLKVPAKAQTLMKKRMPRASVDRLKNLVLMVKNTISAAHCESRQPGRGKTRARFVDVVPIVRKRRKRLRSRHPIIDAFLHEEDGDDAYADLEDFIE